MEESNEVKGKKKKGFKHLLLQRVHDTCNQLENKIQILFSKGEWNSLDWKACGIMTLGFGTSMNGFGQGQLRCLSHEGHTRRWLS